MIRHLRCGLWCAPVLALLFGCARVEPPPGGPEDELPPSVVAIRPDSLSTIGAGTRQVVIVFNERISEKGFEDSDPAAVVVSPRTSAVRVERGRDELQIELRRGWEPGRIYHVTILPVVQDLFGNRMVEPVQVVFSTGPEIPATALNARITDRITGKLLVGARVEAITTTDSLVYALPTDSAGTVQFRRIPIGSYAVRAFQDLNRNRALDAFEARAITTVQVRVGDSAGVRLAILLPDSTAPKAAAAELVNGVLQMKFDDYLDAEQTVSPTQVRVVGPDGSTVVVERVAVGPLPAAPSAPSPGDTVAPLPGDTLRRLPAGQAAAPDTTPVPAPLPNQKLYIELGGELLADTIYQVQVRDVRNVAGLSGGGEVPFRTPRPPAPPPPAQPAAPAPQPGDSTPAPEVPAPSSVPAPAREQGARNSNPTGSPL